MDSDELIYTQMLLLILKIDITLSMLCPLILEYPVGFTNIIDQSRNLTHDRLKFPTQL